MALFKHQHDTILKMRERVGAFIAHDLGCGKTLTAIGLDYTRRRTSGNPKLKTLIICPLSVIPHWKREYNKWCPELKVLTCDNKNRKPFIAEMLNPDSKYQVFVIHFAAVRLEEESLVKLNLFHVVVDECLISGTKISTPTGNRNIEDLQVGDIVYGYDHNINQVVETKVKAAFGRVTYETIFDVDGIGITGNHPVWTNESKYVEASLLDVTYHTVLKLEYDQTEKTSTERSGYKNMRVVRKPIRSRKVLKRQTPILQHEMFQYLEGSSLPQKGASKNNRKRTRVLASKYGKGAERPKTTRVFEFEPQPIQESRNRGGYSSKSASYIGSTWLQSLDRWNGQFFYATNYDVLGIGSRLDTRKINSSWTRKALRNRYSTNRVDDSSRDRRRISQITTSNSKRFGERQFSAIVGMEDLPIPQPRNSIESDWMRREGTRVYNIETGAGNYFANGVLVHNCHNLQNRKASQTKAIKNLRARYRSALTGTPIHNKPDGFWSLLNFLYPDVWRSYWKFFNRYILWVNWTGYKEIIGIQNEAELMELIEPFYSRVKKSDVYDLPDIYYTTIEVELDAKQKRAYKQMKADMLAWVGDHEHEPINAPIAVAQLTRLRQFACAYAEIERKEVKGELVERVRSSEPSTKLDAAMEIIQGTDQQVVVFSSFSQLIELLGKRLEKAGIPHGILIGSVSRDERERVVNEFQDGKLKVFAGTIKAGGEGIELTAASTLIFLDREWAQSRNEQAIGRLHRYGQKNNIQVIDIVAKDTLDDERNEGIAMSWNMVKKMLGELK